jgi:hypothetical protein
MFRLIRNLFHKTREVGSYVGTFRTHDAAFAFRMNTGFPGTVNRTHPASIEPCLIDPNATIAAYGMGVIVDSATQGVRTLVAGDGAVTNLYGIAARPYPVQAASASSYGATTFGSGAPPPSQPLDVLKGGYILVALNNFAVNNSVKNGPVYVNISTSTTNHVQGGFEAAANSGCTTIEITNAYSQNYFNGPAGPDGVVELAFNL